jgi:copper chaperone CopZ
MKLACFIAAACCAAPGLRAAEAEPTEAPSAPHTPTLIFYLTGAENPKDAEAITAAVHKLKSVSRVDCNRTRSYVQVRFDSHVVSYHEVAQAIADAGASLGKKYDPRLKVTVPAYAQPGNAAKVDALFAGKRLNQRVTIEAVDKTKGQFLVHFLPLKIDPAETGPQGFNGGHLNHPLHDPPPRGLGLECKYASDDT